MGFDESDPKYVMKKIREFVWENCRRDVTLEQAGEISNQVFKAVRPDLWYGDKPTDANPKPDCSLRRPTLREQGIRPCEVGPEVSEALMLLFERGGYLVAYSVCSDHEKMLAHEENRRYVDYENSRQYVYYGPELSGMDTGSLADEDKVPGPPDPPRPAERTEIG